MPKNVNRQFRLKQRPVGRVGRGNFELVDSPVPAPGPNQALVRNLYLSLDPTNRMWMSDMDQYMPPVAIGEVMRGGGIGQVVASNDPAYVVGELVQGLVGWQDYVLSGGDEMPLMPLPKGLPVPATAMLGALGATGITAYFGLLEIGQPKAGETVLVSAAAGAVGSVVGQIAKIKGCRAVGIAGSREKCRWITEELCFDAAVNYKEPGWREALDRACPAGIDVDFENVGGEIMDAVFARLNLHARVALCGMISGYNATERMLGDFQTILMKRVRVEGFIILDYLPRFAEAAAELGRWLVEGKLKHRETIVDGLENAPAALNKLFDGENIGKLIVKIADPS